MPERDIEEYKAGWEQRARQAEARNEAARIRALETAQELSDLLVRKYDVRKVILYGSVLEPGRFGERSDIDLGVEGLPKARYFEALALLAEASPFEVDLKPMEDVGRLLRQRMAKGNVLYEKRTNT